MLGAAFGWKDQAIQAYAAQAQTVTRVAVTVVVGGGSRLLLLLPGFGLVFTIWRANRS